MPEQASGQYHRSLGVVTLAATFMLVLLTALIAQASPQTATTYYVNGTGDPAPSACTVRSGGGYDCASLRSAIIAANTNFGRDTILLHHNTTYQLTILAGGPDDATKGDLDVLDDVNFGYTSLCFSGTCGATIQGGAGWNDRLVEFHVTAEVNLVNVTFRNGGSVYIQGGAIMNSGILTLTSGLVISNAASSGGGIFNDSTGVLKLISTQVTSNTALNANGGGLRNDGTAYLTDIQFDKNYADKQGGAIANSGPLMIISGSLISGNLAHDAGTSLIAGGGIFNTETGVLILTATQVLSNTAWNGGGGLANEWGKAYHTGVTIANNKVLNSGRGGGIHNSGYFTLNDTAILSNAAAFGGGIATNYRGMTVTHAMISGNSAASKGGGIYVVSSAKLTLSASQIMSNTSLDEGGGFDNYGLAIIDRSTFSGNHGLWAAASIMKTRPTWATPRSAAISPTIRAAVLQAVV
jgi:predicted outer membrane repeat protein